MFRERLLGILPVVILAAASLRAGEPEAPPKTLAEQITYLEGALTEGIQTRDFTMLETVVSGFKAANLAEKDLEPSLLRAERNAAWLQMQMQTYGQADYASMEAWGLIARAMLGSTQAAATLRQYAEYVPPNAPPAAVPGVKQDPKDFMARQKAMTEQTAKFRKRDQAILALALLKEPGIRDKALAAITQDNATRDMAQMQYYGAMDPLIQAVVLADPQAGYQALVDFCANEKNTVAQQAGMLSKLSGLYAPSYGGADEKFSITQIVRNTVPIDGQKKLIEMYGGIVKRYEPPKDPQQQWDPTLNLLSNVGNVFPANSLTPDGIAAVEALIEKLPGDRNQYPKQSFNSILKRNGKEPPKDTTPNKPKTKPSLDPVKPPKPPDQF